MPYVVVNWFLKGIIFCLLSYLRIMIYEKHLRFSKKLTLLIIFIFSMMIPLTWLGINQYVNFEYAVYRIIWWFLFICLSCWLIKLQPYKHIIPVFLTCVYSIFIETIGGFVEENVQIFYPTLHIHSIQIIVDIFFYSTTFFIIKKYLKHIVEILQDCNNKKLYISIVIICSIITIASFVASIPISSNYTIRTLVFRMLAFILILVVDGLLIETINNIRSNERNLSKLKYIENVVIAQNDYYIKLNQQYNEVREIKHDMKHHFGTMFAMAKNNEFNDLTKYLETVCTNNALIEQIRYSGNLVVDSLLCYYFDLYALYDISKDILLDLPSTLPISEIEFCTVMGNLLENALEACKYVPSEERYIKIIANNDKLSFTMKIENSYDGYFLIEKNQIKSRKNFNRIGIGIESVKNICEKTNGVFKIDKTEKVFIVQIGWIKED